jgi:hypothetical protein
MGCPYSEEELQKYDSVNNPIGEVCDFCDDCDCDHWSGDCKGCEKFEKWPDCGGPYRDQEIIGERGEDYSQ